MRSISNWAILILALLAAGLITFVTIQFFYVPDEKKPNIKIEKSVKSEPTKIDSQSTSGISPSPSKPRLETKSTGNSTMMAWLIILSSLLSITVLVSIGISFYLYRWRKLIVNNNAIVVPEQLGAWTKGVSDNITNLVNSFSHHYSGFVENGEKTNQKIKTRTPRGALLLQYFDLIKYP